MGIQVGLGPMIHRRALRHSLFRASFGTFASPADGPVRSRRVMRLGSAQPRWHREAHVLSSDGRPSHVSTPFAVKTSGSSFFGVLALVATPGHLVDRAATR